MQALNLDWKINEARNYLLEEKISKKQKKTCSNLNYFEHSLISVSAAADCVLISTFAT